MLLDINEDGGKHFTIPRIIARVGDISISLKTKWPIFAKLVEILTYAFVSAHYGYKGTFVLIFVKI